MKKLISLLICIVAIYIVTIPKDLGAQALRVLLPVQGGTGISTSSPTDIGKCIKVLSDSPFKYELASCGGIGGDPTIIQIDGTPQSVGTPTLNFTGNSFAVTESPADTFTLRVSTTTLGLLASSISDFVSTVRTSISETIEGLTYTSGTGVLSLDSGYTIPTTTRAVAWDNKGNGTVTSVDMSVPTGLTIAGNPISTSGTLALTLTSGYTIPSTTRMVNHDTAFGWGNHSGLYDILGQATSTLGTHTTTYNHTNYNTAYSWGNHAGLYDPLGQATSSINLLTAGDGLTRTLNDFDCDTASASVFGCLSITDWATFMGKVATSSIDSLGEIETLTSVANILIENDIDASSELAALMDDETGAGNLVFSDSPTLTGGARFVGINVSASSTLGFASSTALTVSGNTVLASATSTNLFSTLGTFTNLVVNTLATFLNVVVTGLLDVGGGVLEIPNGTAPVIDSIGEIGLDSTDDQLIMADGGGTARVFGTDEFRVVSLTMASSSLQFDSGDLLAVLGNKDGLEITQFRCYVVGGTSKVVNLTDGTNDTETITCGTTMTSDTDVATNDTFTADEIGSLEMGATTGTVNYLHFEAWARITRE